jgi:hypothetical protein
MLCGKELDAHHSCRRGLSLRLPARALREHLPGAYQEDMAANGPTSVWWKQIMPCAQILSFYTILKRDCHF